MLLASALLNASIYSLFLLFSLPHYEQWVGFIINSLMIDIMWSRYGSALTAQLLLSGRSCLHSSTPFGFGGQLRNDAFLGKLFFLLAIKLK